MRILIFHGYLLEGTGSNVYNARLAAALVALGHEVHLLCQDRHPERQPFVDAVGEWERGALRVRVLREPVRCTVYRPDIGAVLPVYVHDRYEGIEARTFADCDEQVLTRYLDANVAAVDELVARVRPQAALANHLVMGPAILARGLAGSGVPYAVKVHGSALEYTVKPEPERFLGFAREGLADARAILVGSEHTALSLWETMDDPAVRERTRLGPPGVDIAHFCPRGQREAAEGLRAIAARLRAGGAGPEVGQESTFARDDLAAAAVLERLRPGHDRLVAFVGKLIVNKGVDLLIAAWPLVLAQVPRAKLVVVGFGTDRAWLERLLDALAVGDLQRAGDGALRHLSAFLGELDGIERERYTAAARALPEQVLFTGRLDHEELTELLPACEALVVPSTFPEAFGMVAAEAAACGALPISAAHSGLAEVSHVLAGAVPAEVAEWLSFQVDDTAVRGLAECVVRWLRTEDPELRTATRAGLVAAAREHWSWEGVARRVVAAAHGELEGLPRPGDAARPVG